LRQGIRRLAANGDLNVAEAEPLIVLKESNKSACGQSGLTRDARNVILRRQREAAKDARDAYEQAASQRQ
jgi:hypothetical protein